MSLTCLLPVSHLSLTCLLPARRLTGSDAASENLSLPLARHLDRVFTPRSASAVGSALEQMTQELAQEEQAQLHQLSPALAALRRGECTSVPDLVSLVVPNGLQQKHRLLA